MAELEAEAFLAGNWKSYHELEENISLPELNATIKAIRTKERDRQKFEFAMHKGIDMDAVEAKNRFEQIQNRVADKLNSERDALGAVGFAVEEE